MKLAKPHVRLPHVHGPSKDTRRHLAGYGFGIVIMAVGSSIALYGHYYLPVHHLPLDMLAYWLHGVGAAPYVMKLEYFWSKLVD